MAETSKSASVGTSPKTHDNPASTAATLSCNEPQGGTTTIKKGQVVPAKEAALTPTTTIQTVSPSTRRELLSRTVHLRCLPPAMLQSQLADLCASCGELRRVRLCGNSKVGQNWIYGFAEFSTPEGARAMWDLSGVELSPEDGRAPLRLKCGPSVKPIFDCLPLDADPVRGIPCTFGRGLQADKTLNDAILVVKQSSGGAKSGLYNGTRSDGSTAGGCDCGCALDPSVKCCSCCKCRKLPQVAQGGYDLNGARDPVSSCCSGTQPIISATVNSTVLSGRVASTSSTFLNVPTVPSPAEFASLLSVQASSLPHSPVGSSTQVLMTLQHPTPKPVPFLQTTATAAETMLSQAISQMRAAAETRDAACVLAEGRFLVCKALHEIYLEHRAAAPSPTVVPLAGYGQQPIHTLVSLLALLDKYSATLGGPQQCLTSDHTSEHPQRALQLRLFAYLTLCFLALYERRLTEALRWMEPIVSVCHALPAVRLERPTETVPDSYRNTKEAPSVDMLSSSSNSKEDWSIMEEECARMFETFEVHFPNHLIATREGFYHRDYRFHAYVLNILLAMGMSMEGVQPAITKSTYLMAAGRARDILQTTSAPLETAMADENVLLSSVLLPSMSVSGRDITSVPRFFFAEAERHREEMKQSEEHFWSLLPPLSILDCFPLR